MTAAAPALRPGDEAAVVGGGPVGTAAALELARAGAAVSLLSPAPPGTDGAAARNAGHLAFGDAAPFAAPGALLHFAAALAGRGPLVLRPRQALRAAPWMLGFARACAPGRAAAAARAMAGLQRTAREDTRALFQAAGIEDLWIEGPNLLTVRGARRTEAARRQVAAAAALGFEWRLLGRAELAEAEPALLEAGFDGALAPGGSARVRDPARVSAGLWRAAEALGARREAARVDAIEREAGGLTARLEDGRRLGPFAAVVLAAGVETARLARPLGARLPMEAERGCSFTVPEPGVALRGAVLSRESWVAFTPMEGGLRITGFSEPGARGAPPASRAALLKRRARAALPGLRLEGAEASLWHGDRPTLSDSLPAVGPCPGEPRAWVATGHGHLGLTLAAPTAARLRAGLLEGAPPPGGLEPARFGRA